MAHPNRAVLERALKQDWIPELKTKGVRGRPWTFLREREEFVDLVMMELSGSGDGCRILLGVEPRYFPGAIQNEIPDFERMKVTACQFQQYVTTPRGAWFGFGDLTEDDVLILTEIIIDRFDEVSEPSFKEYDNLDCLKSFTPDDMIDNEDVLSRFDHEPSSTMPRERGLSMPRGSSL